MRPCNSGRPRSVSIRNWSGVQAMYSRLRFCNPLALISAVARNRVKRCVATNDAMDEQRKTGWVQLDRFSGTSQEPSTCRELKLTIRAYDHLQDASNDSSPPHGFL